MAEQPAKDVSTPEARRPPSRRGKSTVAFYADPEKAHELRVKALNERKTLQAILGEAMMWLLDPEVSATARRMMAGKAALEAKGK